MKRTIKVKCPVCNGRTFNLAPDDYADSCEYCKGEGFVFREVNTTGMTKRDVIKALEKFDDEMVVVINDGKYWAHIESITSDDIAIEIKMEEHNNE